MFKRYTPGDVRKLKRDRLLVAAFYGAVALGAAGLGVAEAREEGVKKAVPAFLAAALAGTSSLLTRKLALDSYAMDVPSSVKPKKKKSGPADPSV